jgi:transcriptional regulator PpsR
VVDGAKPLAEGRLAGGLESPQALDGDTAVKAIAAAADVTLLMDRAGLIHSAAFGEEELERQVGDAWIGRRWSDVVTTESLVKVEELLRTAGQKAARWRQVNHPSPDEPDIPVRYRTLALGQSGQILAIGRDLRPMAALQKRLIESQQAMEREYARIRNAEKRYRLLFHLAAQSVLIVDLNGGRVLEANPAAAALLGVDPKKLSGVAFDDLFREADRQAIRSFLAATRMAPRVDNVHAQLARNQMAVLLTGSVFRQDGSPQLVVLLAPRDDSRGAATGAEAEALRLIDALPEGFATLDADRRVLLANNAFLDLVEATSPSQALGQPIDRWLGRASVEVDVLFASLQAHGAVRNFSSVLRGELGTVEDVQVAAASVESPDGAGRRHALAIRAAGSRGGPESLGGREIPRTVEQFTHLVGRAPMKTLVRETTDLIEKLCIQAAVELTQGNRAAAAEMLGVSRQALYVKLRRHGLIGEAESDDD